MIDEVTRTLVDHLQAATADIGANWIQTTSLGGSGALAQDKLHVCLYAVAEHSHLRNQPLQRAARGGYELPPIALGLHYLLVFESSTDDHLEQQARLSRIIQVFHTQPILGPASLSTALPPRVQQLTVRLHSPGPEERSQIWGAYSRPLQLALYYEVDVAFLPPLAHEGAGEISDHEVRYAELAP